MRRSLYKDPRQRVRDIGDLRLALEGAFDGAAGVSAPAVVETRARRPWPALPLAIAAFVVGSAIAGLAVWRLAPEPSRPVSRMVVSAPPNAAVGMNALRSDVALSADGTLIVYWTEGSEGVALQVRAVDQLEATPLRGPVEPHDPFLSPDGNWVGFMPLGGPLQKVSVLGGPVVTICELPAPLRGASWGSNGEIVFGVATGDLMRVSAEGGEPEVLSAPEGVSHWWPDILPGDAGVLISIVGDGQARIAVLDPDTGEHRVIVRGGSHGRYSPTGHIVYATPGRLWAVAFDIDALEVTGDPVPLVDNVVTKGTGAADFALSDTGSLVYVMGVAAAGSGESTLVWVDRDGREETLPLPAARYGTPRLSPDGRRLAVPVSEPGQRALWVYDVGSGVGLQLTHEGNAGAPVWTPEGERLIFGLSLDGDSDLHSVSADGSGAVERLATSDAPDRPTSITPDGRTVVFTRNVVAARQSEIWQMPVDGEPTMTPLLAGDFYRTSGEVAPNGDWLAYRSGSEVYVQPYPGPGSIVPVSGSTGTYRSVVWARDGSEIYFREQVEDRMMAATVEMNGTIRPGAPTTLFDDNYVPESPGGPRQFDVAPDGRFLMKRPGDGTAAEVEAPNQVVLVQNWAEELAARVPVP